MARCVDHGPAVATSLAPGPLWPTAAAPQTKHRRCHTKHPLKHPRKMERIAESRLPGHRLHQRPRLAQSLRRRRQFLPHQIPVRRLAGKPPKQSAQMRPIHVAGPGYLRQVPQFRMLGLDQCTTSLIREKRLAGLRFSRSGRHPKLEPQTFEQALTQRLAAGTRPQPGIDQFLEQPLQRIGWLDPNHSGRPKPPSLQSPARLPSVHIDEVLHQGRLARGCDLMRHPRAVRKHVARPQILPPPSQPHPTPPRHHVFQRPERKIAPLNSIRRHAFLAPATDHPHARATIPGQVPVKPSGPPDLGREKRGRATADRSLMRLRSRHTLADQESSCTNQRSTFPPRPSFRNLSASNASPTKGHDPESTDPGPGRQTNTT